MKLPASRRVIGMLGIGLGGLALASWAQVQPNSPQFHSVRTKIAAIPETENYAFWREVTRNPVEMDPRVAGMCASVSSRSSKPPSSSSTTSTIRGTRGPHQKKFIRVYVNSVAEDAMMTQKQPHFPVGSVIVKQKLPLLLPKFSKSSKSQHREVSRKPELLTVMIKRKKGYDAPNGDWEYLVADGVGEKVVERGKLASCQGCHRPFAKSDYIVRSYLPKSVEMALREIDSTATVTKPVSKPVSGPEKP